MELIFIFTSHNCAGPDRMLPQMTGRFVSDGEKDGVVIVGR
jgi:hypothetical protein